jgi:hypothetical protein
MCAWRFQIVLSLATIFGWTAVSHTTPAEPNRSADASDSALALVKSLMREARREMPESDQIASISWTRDPKGQSDADWVDQGLGAYLRTQVPPDVIDRVQDIEIIFSAEDPSSLTGKIVDTKDRKLFVHG